MRRAARFLRTALRAAKYLPTVRRALPVYVWPVLALALVVKLVPVDFGVDELLLGAALALVWWRRPGLLQALYAEAKAETEGE